MTALPTPAALLEPLNAPQREAVLHNAGPLLVLAGAGSGKTRTVTHKLAYLCAHEGYLPSQILAVTFTNKAAGEMRERVAQLLGGAAELTHVATFHATGLRILRSHAALAGLQPGFGVYDKQDQLALMKQVMADAHVSDKVHAPQDLLAWIEQRRNDLRPLDAPSDPPRLTLDAVAAPLAQRYVTALRAANAVDFGDLIAGPVQLFERHPEILGLYQRRWRYVLVDEFQDTNLAQYRLLRLLVGERGTVCAVGDDDQSIYRWRGARVENLQRFEDDFAGTRVISLDQNYRSTATILEAAGAVIGKNPHRHPKRLWTAKPRGEAVGVYEALDDIDEARFVAAQARALHARVPLERMAVFYRTHAQSRAIEDALRAAAIPYRVYGGLRFYDRAEIKDLIAYLRVVHNPADTVSLLRILNVPARGLGRTTAARLVELARLHDVSVRAAIPLLAAQVRSDTARKLAAFDTLLDELAAAVALPDGPLRLLLAVLERTRYVAELEADDSLEAATRLDNVRELVNSVEEFCASEPGAGLADYLDRVSLVTDFDEAEPSHETLTLMTVHSAKGLEFDVVFVVGLEEGILPHVNSLRSPVELAEERRLCYVAMTRARERLFLSCAAERRRFGSFEHNAPSRFLLDVPPQCRREAAPRAGAARRPAPAPWPTPAPLPPPRPSVPASAPRAPDELHYEYDPGPLTAGEALGLRVRHAVFGEGVITGADGDRVRVRFEQAGPKTVLARYLLPAEPL